MKKIVIASLLLICGFAKAQNFQGMAVYESKTNTANMTSGWSGNREMTPELKARIEERMKTMFEKTFILTFDKTTSWYSEEEKMDAVSSNQGFGRMMMSSFSSGNLFKNTKEKVFLQEREFFGKEFLIKDSLTNYKWEMSAETKQIGNYLCYKASAKKITSPTDFRSYRRTDSDKEKATQSKDSIKSKSSNLTAGWDIPKETFITAWYTMDIPISQGPENYWGLPGLILEVNDGTTTILCSKIVINPKDRKEIKQPKKGTPITQKEFEKIAQEKIEEMREMGGGMNGGGNRMRMN
ncbi:GLPGLI family protein [Flavobacterium sp.]|jgi:GLPGLI family protein|uniref:GLPGLI family protein n=1 Tax=Flavobacterium sp. TaxID=239 RepID=UPI0037C0D3D0